jgi:hypothetical protein
MEANERRSASLRRPKRKQREEKRRKILSFSPTKRDISKGYGDPLAKIIFGRSAARTTSKSNECLVENRDGGQIVEPDNHGEREYSNDFFFPQSLAMRTLQKSESCDSLGFSKRMIRS